MWKVYVGNLDSHVTERELADEFRAFGVVRRREKPDGSSNCFGTQGSRGRSGVRAKSVWIARNPPGYAFVEFDDRRDADDAISALDGKHGWRVEMSRNYGSGRSRGRGSSDVRCYDCGAPGHFARECRSKGTRNSYRRSPNPHSRTSGRRYDSTRNGHDYSRSPRRDNTSSYAKGSPTENDRWRYRD